jgi:UDP-N-acetylglucosamine 2-epimerase (non-hydrolysing)
VKVLTILGTRPEIIRLSLIIKKLDALIDGHVLVHTGQNFTHELNNIFFKELDLRKPDYVLSNEQKSLGEQLSLMFIELERILIKEKPNKILLLGDTNSGLSSILAERLGIPVVHLEAGNRCFDINVPEEKNRKIIDAISTYNLVYTSLSKNNLLREGVHPSRIFKIGNPIYEVINYFEKEIKESEILKKLKLKRKDYFLVTVHRAENVDHPQVLTQIINALNTLTEVYKKRIIVSTHPRTRSKINSFIGGKLNDLVEFHDPFGFFDFVKLEKNSFMVLTDSGTVQEECCIFQVPTVTMRKTTERPETVECGSNFISGVSTEKIVNGVKVMNSRTIGWDCPTDYLDLNVSEKVINIILGGSKIVS